MKVMIRDVLDLEVYQDSLRLLQSSINF